MDTTIDVLLQKCYLENVWSGPVEVSAHIAGGSTLPTILSAMGDGEGERERLQEQKNRKQRIKYKIGESKGAIEESDGPELLGKGGSQCSREVLPGGSPETRRKVYPQIQHVWLNALVMVCVCYLCVPVAGTWALRDDMWVSKLKFTLCSGCALMCPSHWNKSFFSKQVSEQNWLHLHHGNGYLLQVRAFPPLEHLLNTNTLLTVKHSVE